MFPLEHGLSVEPGGRSIYMVASSSTAGAGGRRGITATGTPLPTLSGPG